MAEKILYAALAVSIVGLLILTYASEVLEPPLSSIGAINPNSLGKNLRVQGNVSRFHEFKGGSAIMTVRDASGEINVYLEYSLSKALPEAKKASAVEVTGEIEEYRGTLELKPKKTSAVRILR